MLAIDIHFSADFWRKTKDIFVWTSVSTTEDSLFCTVEMDALLLLLLLLLNLTWLICWYSTVVIILQWVLCYIILSAFSCQWFGWNRCSAWTNEHWHFLIVYRAIYNRWKNGFTPWHHKQFYRCVSLCRESVIFSSNMTYLATKKLVTDSKNSGKNPKTRILYVMM